MVNFHRQLLQFESGYSFEPPIFFCAFLSIFSTVGISLIFWVILSQQRLASLRSKGVTVDATVFDKNTHLRTTTSNNHRSTRTVFTLIYEFNRNLNGQLYKMINQQAEVTSVLYNSTPVGGTLRVRYMNNPYYQAPEESINQTQCGFGFIIVFAIFWNGIVFFMASFMGVYRSIERALLFFGLTALFTFSIIMCCMRQKTENAANMIKLDANGNMIDPPQNYLVRQRQVMMGNPNQLANPGLVMPPQTVVVQQPNGTHQVVMVQPVNGQVMMGYNANVPQMQQPGIVFQGQQPQPQQQQQQQQTEGMQQQNFGYNTQWQNAPPTDPYPGNTAAYT